MNATTLPILDLARYTNPAEKSGFLADLRQAARDIGCLLYTSPSPRD